MLLSLVDNISTITSDSGADWTPTTVTCTVRRMVRRSPTLSTPDAAVVEQPDELAGGCLRSDRPRGRSGTDASVVGQQRVVRTGIDECHPLAPPVDDELVVVAGPVADHGAPDPSDPGIDERRPACRTASGDHRQRIVLDRIVGAGQQRVAAADEVDVAVDHPVGDGRHGNRGRERVVRAEHVERGERDEQLLIAGRDHRQVGVERGHRHSVDGDRRARSIADERQHRIHRYAELCAARSRRDRNRCADGSRDAGRERRGDRARRIGSTVRRPARRRPRRRTRLHRRAAPPAGRSPRWLDS